MKRMKKRSTLIVIALVVLALAGAGFWLARGKSSSAGHAKEAATARPTLTVTVAKPETSELNVTLSANGNVAAWQEASIGSESNGLRLAEVRVNVGDAVKKGQVLAVFSGDSVDADVAQAKASLAEARATAADAAGTAARARTLQATGAMSQQQINQYTTAEQTAKARVEAAEAVLAAQQVRGRNTKVMAPDDGVISSRTATVGSVVSAGTELFRLIRQGRLEWRAEITSSELGRITVGTPAVVVSATGAMVNGKVRSVAPTVDPQTRNALIYVDIPDVQQNTGIKAGMFARGDFMLGRNHAVTVPLASVVPRDGFNHLLVMQPDSRVSMLRIETGRRVGDRVEITTPLPPDARVVVQGAGFLNDGDLVRVVDSLPTAGGAGSAPSAAVPVKPANDAAK